MQADNKQVATSEMAQLLQKFAETLGLLQEQAAYQMGLQSWEGNLGLALVPFSHWHSSQWLLWIALHKNRENFDMDLFKSFGPGLLEGFSDAQKAAFPVKNESLFQCGVYSWLKLERKPRDNEADEAFDKKFDKALDEAATLYARIFVATYICRSAGAASGDSIRSKQPTSEVKVERPSDSGDDGDVKMESESEDESKLDSKPSISLPPTTTA